MQNRTQAKTEAKKKILYIKEKKSRLEKEPS